MFVEWLGLRFFSETINIPQHTKQHQNPFAFRSYASLFYVSVFYNTKFLC